MLPPLPARSQACLPLCPPQEDDEEVVSDTAVAVQANRETMAELHAFQPYEVLEVLEAEEEAGRALSPALERLKELLSTGTRT